MDLAGKTVVITGASSGIGRRTALELAAEGAVICAVARREERLRSLLQELPPGDHSFFVADVSQLDEVRALGRHVSEKHGRCDVLVNNAGFSTGGAFKGEPSIDDVERVMATNFFGTVYCTAILLELLEASAPSTVVNVASMAGRLAFPSSSAYVASKFAVVGWSESAAFDLRKKGIKVGLVEPGPIPTEGFPQERFVDHPLMKHVLGTEQDVSRTIRAVIVGGKTERVVPRWYYLLQLPRIAAPRIYRFFARRV